MYYFLPNSAAKQTNVSSRKVKIVYWIQDFFFQCWFFGGRGNACLKAFWRREVCLSIYCNLALRSVYLRIPPSGATSGKWIRKRVKKNIPVDIPCSC